MERPDWVISDTHFLHTKLAEVYCARTTPMLPTVDDVDALMVANWHALVKPTDTILHLGDLGWFKGDDYPWLRDLPGRKLLVRGNHDNKLSTEWLAEHGFEEIEAPEYEYKDFRIVCTHYPQDPRDLPGPTTNIHGHVHNNPTDSTHRHLNACVELWNYAPIRFEFAADKLHFGFGQKGMDYGRRNYKRRSKR
jgi:calcineurin-like phosphoesterase family protein